MQDGSLDAEEGSATIQRARAVEEAAALSGRPTACLDGFWKGPRDCNAKACEDGSEDCNAKASEDCNANAQIGRWLGSCTFAKRKCLCMTQSREMLIVELVLFQMLIWMYILAPVKCRNVILTEGTLGLLARPGPRLTRGARPQPLARIIIGLRISIYTSYLHGCPRGACFACVG